MVSNLRLIGTVGAKRLTKEELEELRATCSAAIQLIDGRDSYLTRNKLDPKLFNPGGIWSDPDVKATSAWFREALVSDGYLNRLRLVCPHFSGGQLLPFDLAIGLTLNDAPPEEIDHAIATQGEFGLHPDWVVRFNLLIGRVPEAYVVRPPRILGESGYDVEGVIVNQDTCSYQERMNILFETELLDWLHRRAQERGVCRIVEIGSGYGALAHQLAQRIPALDYLAVDLPESLAFAATYLRRAEPTRKHRVFSIASPEKTLRGGPAMRFVPNYAFDRVTRDAFPADLVINTLSFSEMTAPQVEYYAERARLLIGDDGLLFEQNQDNRPIGHIYCKQILERAFPYRGRTDPVTMVMYLGEADFWANRPVQDIIKMV